MKIKHKIWFEAHGSTIFGPGRDVVFKKIDECHSLNSAAKKLNISYRLAWGKIKVAEERLGIHMVEVSPGEKKLHLTKGARELLAIFDDLEKEIAPILQKAEDKIAALKKRYIENEVPAVKEKANYKILDDNQPVDLNEERRLRNSKHSMTQGEEDKVESKKNLRLLKSLFYLFILPLMEIAYRIEEEAEILMYF
jgi:molybdate transport system regulatory protein